MERWDSIWQVGDMTGLLVKWKSGRTEIIEKKNVKIRQIEEEKRKLFVNTGEDKISKEENQVQNNLVYESDKEKVVLLDKVQILNSMGD